MTTVSILGTGNMGSAIASVVENGGNRVQLIREDAPDTCVSGDIVVLAVPYGAIKGVVGQRSEQLAGKVVVDITNPLDFETFDSLVVAPDSSAAAELAPAPVTTPTPSAPSPRSSPRAACAPSTPAPCAGPASWRPSVPPAHARRRGQDLLDRRPRPPELTAEADTSLSRIGRPNPDPRQQGTGQQDSVLAGGDIPAAGEAQVASVPSLKPICKISLNRRQRLDVAEQRRAISHIAA